MDVAILYSGGKDSTFAIQHAVQKGWNIRYLISVKPTRKDCYLFHYATVEHTKELSRQLGIKHIYVGCSVADPVLEADIVKNVVEEQQKIAPVNAVVLGGTGLQETQLKSIQKALLPLRIDVFAAHAGEEHDLVMEQMLNNGYEIIITQVASDGLGKWLGKKLSKKTFEEFKKDSAKYGFHVGGEGGYYDTLVVNAPFFSERLVVENCRITMEDEFCGHVDITQYKMEKNQNPEIKEVF